LDVQASVEPTGKQPNMLLHVTHSTTAGFLPVVFVSLFLCCRGECSIMCCHSNEIRYNSWDFQWKGCQLSRAM